jgi:hypothetical protein
MMDLMLGSVMIKQGRHGPGVDRPAHVARQAGDLEWPYDSGAILQGTQNTAAEDHSPFYRSRSQTLTTWDVVSQS